MSAVLVVLLGVLALPDPAIALPLCAVLLAALLPSALAGRTDAARSRFRASDCAGRAEVYREAREAHREVRTTMMNLRVENRMVMHTENRMMEFATTNKHRPPAATASRRTQCDTCHTTNAECSQVVRQYRGAEVRLSLCQPCLKTHVIRRQDRARLDTATEARAALDATAARRAGRPTSTPSTTGGWRGQIAALRRAMPGRLAVRR